MKTDYIIVGQGLAGSCLALQLIKRNVDVLVFDEPANNRASSIAAGLFNPVTGNRMNKSWNADGIFPYLFRFYKEAEDLLRQKFFHPMPIYRPFISVEEQNEWMSLTADPGIRNFVGKISTKSTYDGVKDHIGGILVNYSGYLDVNKFIDSIRDLLRKKDSYSEEMFDAGELQPSPDDIRYKNVTAKRIVFCDGNHLKANRFFNWVPVKPLKGETLLITANKKPEVIFNRGVYLVPSGKENSFVAGATYKPNDASPGITEEARVEIGSKLEALLTFPFEVRHQTWGIRPTTPDRKPVLGAHSSEKNIYIFNGLGTKGVSLAPYFSDVLAGHLEEGLEMPTEVNIARFKPLYS